MKKAPLNVRRGQVYLARLNGVGSEQRGKRPVVVIQNNTGNRFSPTISSSIKFEEMSEQWFNEYAILNLRNTTLVRTKQLTTRVYSALGYMKLDKITSRHIQQFITDLALNGRNFQTRKPLSRKTVIHHLSFISDVLSYAVKMGMISDNPCSRVTVPRGEQKEKGINTLEEVAQLFSLVENEPMKYHTFFILSMYSGFRRGEMLGLEWKNVDFENNIISVHRTSNYTKATGYYTDTTKTKKSQRSMKFPEIVMDLLKKWKSEQEAQAKLMGNKWIDTDRLFTKDTGEPMFPCMPYKWLEKLCKRNDLPFYGIHSIRHINNMKTSLLKIRLKSHISPHITKKQKHISLNS